MKLYDTLSDEIVDLTVPEILEEINRDRTEDWRAYTKHDWRDGLQFTYYELLSDAVRHKLTT
jgi:hypothetical protein